MRAMNSVVVLAILRIAVCGITRGVSAQDWPQRPVRILVPFAAEGVTDSIVWISSEWLGRRLAQSVIVENQPGANGVIALDHATVLREATEAGAALRVRAKLD